MREVGQVIEVSGDSAVVRFERSSACKECGACMMTESQKEMLLHTSNTLEAAVGDMVEMDLETPRLLWASALSYIFPLLMLIAGILLGVLLNDSLHVFKESELMAAIFGLAFVGIAYLVLHSLEPRFRKNHEFSPKMVAKVRPEDAVINCENKEDNDE